MAINYQKVGWDTTKYVNPTNMNNMDNGIKSACDGVDQLNATMTVVQNKLDNKTTTNRDIDDSSEGGLLIHHIDGASVQNGTPTPTSPVPIDSVSVKVKTQSKNPIAYPYGVNTGDTYRGITVAVNNDGTIHCTGTSTSTGDFYPALVSNLKLPNGTYKVASNTTASNIGVRVYGVNASGNATSLASSYGTAVSFTADSSLYEYYRVNIRIGTAVTNADITLSPMMVEEEQSTNFEKGYTSVADTSLVLRSIGDIKDELIFEDNKYKVLRRIGHKRILGSFINAGSSMSGNTVQLSSGFEDRLSGNVQSMCSGFAQNNTNVTTVANADTALANGEFAQRNSSTNITTYIKHTAFTSNADAIALFNANEIYMDYPLATSTVEELTDDAIKLLGLKSWNEQTHITLDSVVDTPITVEYATNNGNGRGLNGYTVALANEIKLNQLTMATMLSE